MLNRVIRVAGCAVVLWSFCVPIAARDVSRTSPSWPQWRGPGRDDISTDKGLLQTWPAGGPPLVWTGTGLGDGYSSVVIDDGRIFTTGDRNDGEYLICLDDTNGKEIWSKRIGDAWHDGGARSTPTTDGKLVYALTPGGDLVSLQPRMGPRFGRRILRRILAAR